MLEGLTKIDWTKLTHAYGEASDVPELITSLASKDEEERKSALWELYGNIFHQGTRYEATPYAIPFIFELIRDPQILDKANLIKFTVDLALGYPEAFLPKGPNVEDWAFDAEQLKEEEEAKGLDDIDEDWLKHIDAFINSYKSVLKEVPTYYKFLASKDSALKIMAIFAIAWFREVASESANKIRPLIAKEKNELILANLLISLSMLDSYIEDKKDEQLFRNLLSNHDSMLVKMTAAIALVNILEEDVDITPIDYILKHIPSIIEFELSPFEFPWNDGELKFCAVQSPERVIPDLSKLLSKLQGVKALNVIYSLLWIVFPELPEQGTWTLKKLNKYQKMVLKVLAKNESLWTDEASEVTDLKDLLNEYRLPNDRKSLIKLLQIDSK
jgi:hypothetical protein